MTPFGVCFAFQAKLLAVIQAVDFLKLHSRNFMLIDCNFLYMVHALKNRSMNVPRHLKANCSHFLNTLNIVYHIYLESNEGGECSF